MMVLEIMQIRMMMMMGVLDDAFTNDATELTLMEMIMILMTMMMVL